MAFVALHGSDGEDGTVQGLLEAIGVPYTGSGPAACMRCTDKALAKYLMREAGIPTPAFAAFKESAIKELGVAAALPGLERSIGFPLVAKPASQGSALGVKFARSARSSRGRSWGRSPTTARSCSSATSGAATWPCRCSTRRPQAAAPMGPRGACGAAGRRGDPARRGVLQLRVALRDRYDDVRLPGRAARRRRPSAHRSWRWRRTGCSAATASRGST